MLFRDDLGYKIKYVKSLRCRNKLLYHTKKKICKSVCSVIFVVYCYAIVISLPLDMDLALHASEIRDSS